MLFDPLYWLVIGIGMAISGWASYRVKSTFHKYSQEPTRSGMTGSEVAQRILQDNGINDVSIEPVAGKLSDHYDPREKVLRLSEPVYAGNSMAAFGVAAHEVGHAIQHQQEYAPLQFRSAWVPMANTGSGLCYFVLFMAVIMGGMQTAMGTMLGLAGLVLFGATLVFTLVTLPVEFDASKRALVALQNGGYVTGQELEGCRKVLNAAAMTYVAAFITTLLMLLYWVMRLGLLGGRN